MFKEIFLDENMPGISGLETLQEIKEKKSSVPVIMITKSEEEYIMEESFFADLAIIKCWKADKDGNLVFWKTARNFNPIMATAAKVTVVEAEEIVEVGALDPDQIHTPSIYTKRLFVGNFEKRIERLTLATANEDL